MVVRQLSTPQIITNDVSKLMHFNATIHIYRNGASCMFVNKTVFVIKKHNLLFIGK